MNDSNKYTQNLSKNNNIVVQKLNHEKPKYNKKLTIIKFLKQKYNKIPKSSIKPHNNNPSKKPLNKIISIKNKLKKKSLFQHRTTNNTNLISNINKISSPPNSIQSHNSESTYNNHKTRISSSFSYPKLSKYSNHDKPKLITQIDHNTLKYNSITYNHQYLILSSFKLLHTNFSNIYKIIYNISLNKLTFQYIHILSTKTFSYNI